MRTILQGDPDNINHARPFDPWRAQLAADDLRAGEPHDPTEIADLLDRVGADAAFGRLWRHRLHALALSAALEDVAA